MHACQPMKGARATQKTVPARLMPAAEFARSQAPHRRAVVHEEMSGGVYVLLHSMLAQRTRTHSDICGRSRLAQRARDTAMS